MQGTLPTTLFFLSVLKASCNTFVLKFIVIPLLSILQLPAILDPFNFMHSFSIQIEKQHLFFLLSNIDFKSLSKKCLSIESTAPFKTFGVKISLILSIVIGFFLSIRPPISVITLALRTSTSFGSNFADFAAYFIQNSRVILI